jgi:hypothetical protein
MVDIRSYDLSQARGLLEPQRQNNWLLQIALPDSRGVRDILIALEGFQPPVETSGVTTLGLLNSQSHVPGMTTTSAASITCKDLVDREVAAAFLRWRRQVYDARTGVVGLSRNFKRTAEVVLFAPDGSYERRYQYHGCWPTSFNPGRFDMNSGDKVLIEVPLSVDRVFPMFI